MYERRQFPRFLAMTPVLYFCGGKQLIGRTVNISLGGMKLETDFDLGVGESMDLAILANGTKIHCRGKVLGIEELGNKILARLYFDRISHSEYRKLSDYLQTLYWGCFQKWVIGGIFIVLAGIAYLMILT